MSFEVHGTIMTGHADPQSVAGAISADNLSLMNSEVSGEYVATSIESKRIRSVIASVDDYLMNLAIAEDLCTFNSV
jgi:hypothetical protein